MMQENKNLFLLNSFLPQSLVNEKLYTAHSIALKKKEVNMEFSAFNLSQDYSLLPVLRMPENRYRLHKNTPFSFLNMYSFCLKSYDAKTKTYNFITKKKKRLSHSSFKESFFSKKEKTLAKGRRLSIFLQGSKFSINGNVGAVKKTLEKRKIKKKRLLFRKSEFLLFSLSLYGKLTILHRFLWKIKEKKKRKMKFLKKGFHFFLKKSQSIQCTFQLKKRKRDVVRLLLN